MTENVIGYLLFGTVISFASPWLVPILTVSPVANWLAGRAYNRWDHAHRKKLSDLETKQACVRKLPDDFKSAKDIRIYSMAGWIRETYLDLTGQLAAENRKRVGRSFLSRIADLFVILLRDGGAYALLISMFLRGEIDAAQFVLYFAAVSSFASWIGGIVSAWNQMHASSLSICFLRDYLDLPEKDGSGEASGLTGSAPEIVFNHVSFRYDGAEDFTIRDLSFTMKSGEKLALVGLNGAGKTTLVKLLCGLYHPTSGEIRINGIPQSKFRRRDYYKLIAPVFQDVRTAFYSLAETVSCTDGEHTDRQKAENALKRAGLWEKIEALPDGMDTKLDKKVNKNGTELSGGEAQKLMLARALCKDAPILVLDEPTAALDPIAEARLYGEYGRMTAGKTSLFVSHRLATTAFCDRVILLEDGRIAEEGTHAELIALEGKYKELYEIQSQWYRENGKVASA
ncbi:MAG: ABC transporter ATP-binding protein [Clostridia bacterium]|nr:ABC transporter ATP-binding protein [Clostridia bacterium]